MIGALLGAGPAMPAMPNPMAGMGATSSAATGDQTQNIAFNPRGVSFGSDSNGTLLIVGVVVVAAFFLLKKK
jgi:hypothetical protein